jgi:hypothetical protein
MNQTPGIEPDPLVEALRPDPAQPDHFVALDGYLGSSTEDGHWRLYRDLSLTFWLEIPEDAIYHVESITVANLLRPLSVVWVRRDIEIRSGTGARVDQRSQFLRGTFTVDLLLEQDTQTWVYALMTLGHRADTGCRY